MEKLIPLKADIAATDHLIDLIVYRLYGLTAEEVNMIETDEVKQCQPRISEIS